MNQIIRMLFAILLAVAAAQEAGAREPFSLDAVRAQVRAAHKDIAQISSDALAAKMKAGDVLLIDVREADEYAVSHLDGAERADPGMRRAAFLERFGAKARGKEVVFYCSVGVRSSRLAENVLAALREQGAKAVYNLDGGVFGWHNEGRPLVNAQGPTEFVHGYDSRWGTLVQRKALTRTAP